MLESPCAFLAEEALLGNPANPCESKVEKEQVWGQNSASRSVQGTSAPQGTVLERNLNVALLCLL